MTRTFKTTLLITAAAIIFPAQVYATNNHNNSNNHGKSNSGYSHFVKKEKTNHNNGNGRHAGNAKDKSDKDHDDKGGKDHDEHGNGKGKGHDKDKGCNCKDKDKDHGDKDHNNDDNNNNGGNQGGNQGGDDNNNGGDNGGNDNNNGGNNDNNGGDDNNNGGNDNNGGNQGGDENDNGGDNGSVDTVASTIANEPAVLMSVAMAGSNSLHKRMGELRDNSACDESGVWIRAYVKHLELDDFIDTNSDIYGFEMGYDQKLDVDVEGVVYAGVMAGLTHTKKLTSKPGHGLKNGSGYGDTPSIGAYATWMGQNGWFMDGTFRTYWSNLHLTSFTYAGPVKFNPNRQISALSFEFGRQFEFARTDVSKWLFTPKFETLYAWADAKSFDSSNGQGIRMGHSQSILAKATAEVAYNKKLDNGMIVEPFAHVALINEFDGETNIKYMGKNYTSDLSGISVEVGGGLNMQVTDAAAFYSEVTYEKGDVVEAISANAGVRYTW